MRVPTLGALALTAAVACSPAGQVQGPLPDPDDLPDTTEACEGVTRDPGRVTLHRLNRAEYDNTVRDLLGTELRPAADFPSDDHGYGFDNIADVLSMSPLLVEKYQLGAEQLVDELLRAPEVPLSEQAEAEVLGSDVGSVMRTTWWNLWSNGELVQPFNVTIAGRYLFETRVFGQQAGPDPVRVDLSVDGRSVGVIDVPETENAPRVLTFEAELTAGPHRFGVGFVNDYYEPPNDRNLIVDWLRVSGPIGWRPDPVNEAAYARIMSCDPAVAGREPCAKEILGGFARRAWRRPPTESEVSRLYALAGVAWDLGDDFQVGISLGLQAILLSPNFLFRVELDPNPSSEVAHGLTPHEVATRLSYFLWSSMPDDALAARADDGSISRPDVLQSEVRRMLADEKAEALVDNFAGQWLYTRRVDDLLPDPVTYPQFDEELKRSMAQETRAFFRSFVQEPRSMLDMLDADFSYLNDRLARHYGLPPVGSDEVMRTSLMGDQRGGILTHASFLSVTSRPKRTAPVIRGKWILEQLMCRAPAPPPPDAGGFPEDASTGTVRERLAAHRADARCATCHNAMDPLGLALERFDGIGQWRTHDGDEPVDDSGVLPDGRALAGARELAAILKTESDVPRCFTDRAFVYAMGRGVVRGDRCSLVDIQSAFQAGGHSFESLMMAVVTHPSFTSRRGEP